MTTLFLFGEIGFGVFLHHSMEPILSFATTDSPELERSQRRRAPCGLNCRDGISPLAGKSDTASASKSAAKESDFMDIEAEFSQHRVKALCSVERAAADRRESYFYNLSKVGWLS